MWWRYLFLLSLSCLMFLTSGTLTTKVPCTNDTDCLTNQCCYIEPEFLIVSKRQATDLPLQTKPKQGYCENYQPLGTPCSPFDKVNGRCSCEHNLTCRFVPAPSPRSIVRRKLVMPGPGAYRCAPPL